MIDRPSWVNRIEAKIGGAIKIHPNMISLMKLLVITPLMLLALRQVDVIPGGAGLVTTLFLGFCALDYLDGVVARERGLQTRVGHLLDRLTDYPLLIMVSFFCLDVISGPLLGAKLGLDFLLLALFALGFGSTQNRLRTVISDATLLALLCFSQGWAPVLFNTATIEALLWVNVLFSATVALYNVDVLQKRFIADMLSGCNLLCGLFSIRFAAMGRVDISLLFLLVGAACDGLDGAAARRWGGTRWGVYSDDVADGVNYGLAPGAAIALVLGGLSGALIGGFYALFTISRLVFFTLNKDGGDPEFFSGAPSTMGALMSLSGLILFASDPALVGLIVGVACVQMVSYDTHYRHLGRALGKDRRAQRLTPALIIGLIVGAIAWGATFLAASLLCAGILYGFLPMWKNFSAAVARKKVAG